MSMTKADWLNRIIRQARICLWSPRTRSHNASRRRSAAEQLETRELLTVSFTFNYAGAIGSGIGFEDSAQGAARRAALESVAATFGSFFTDTASIEVDVTSTDAPASGTLASAGSYYYPGGSPGFTHLVTGTKVLTGVDLTGPDSDATVSVNWGKSWELGNSFQAGEYDFTSVIMHELSHAFGFASLIDQNGTSGLNGAPLGSAGRWAPFDRFISSASGSSLINPLTNVLSSTWTTHSVGGTSPGSGLFFNGYNARTANGGSLVGLYSPTTWRNGSSGSHLDTDNPSYSSLMMIHAVNTGERARTLSAVESGIFRDLGFRMVGVVGMSPVASDDSGAGYSTSEDSAFIVSDLLLNDFDPDPNESEGLYIQSLDTSGTTGTATLVGTGLPQTFTYTGPTAIPDSNAPTNFNLNVSGFQGNIRDVNVKLNINHTWDEDLDVFLESPNGTRIELFTDVGGDGNNFTNTILSDEGILSIEEVGAFAAQLPPFTATYRPVGSLAAFDGQDANGTWKLVVTDDEAGDAGTVVNWSLILRGQHVTYSPSGQFESLNNGQSANDSFQYTVMDAGGSSTTATATVVVNGVTDQGLVVSPTSLVVPEGSTNTFSVSLAAQPAGDVTVSIARTGGDVDLSISSGAVLTFTAATWDIPQTVTLAAAADSDTTDGAATFTVSSAGLTSVNVSAAEDDTTPTSTDILLQSVTADGGTVLTVQYEIVGASAGTFDITFYRSDNDSQPGSDVLLDSVSINSPADLTAGTHVKTFGISSSAADVSLPGAGGTGSTGEYFILAVADAADVVVETDITPVTEDNFAVFTGVYQGQGTVVVHTGPGDDSVVIAAAGSNHTLTIGAQSPLSYSSSLFTQFSVRLHDGNDTLDAAASTNRVFSIGGPGNDSFAGGSAGDEFHGGAGSDSASGGPGNDYLTGEEGNDTLSGGDGIDTLVGGDDNDTLRGDSGSDAVQGGNGNDLLEGSTGDDTLTGGDGSDSLTGGTGFDILDGGSGNDSLSGGADNDRYVFGTAAAAEIDTIVELAAEGSDRLDFSALLTGDNVSINLAGTTTALGSHANRTLRAGAAGQAAQIENLTGGAGNDALVGNAAANILTGNAGNDTLTGNAGNDSLEGAGGNDLLLGGLNNDTYIFDTDSDLGADTLTESGAGTDLIDFSATQSIGVSLNLGVTTPQSVNENLLLTVTSASLVDHITGGAGSDSLTGNALTNRLEGGAGDDTLSGGTGSDLYVFDSDTPLGTDQVDDALGLDRFDFSGTTTQSVSLSLDVTTHQVVNGNLTLVLLSAAAIENVTGGMLNDTINGNTLANILDGGFGDDNLNGGSGNDVLIGGAGNDSLHGGAGNDSYLFDADTALGSDSLTDEVGVETISFAGTSADVTFSLGLATAQSVNGGLLTVTLASASTFDYLTGGGGNDLLSGNANANRLDGGAGNDTLAGGTGNDTYVFDADLALGSDTINESVGAGTDTVNFTATTTGSIVFSLGSTSLQVVNGNLQLTLSSETSVENVAGGAQHDTLTGNGLANSLNGGAGNDVLNGDTGNDTLTGGGGSDTMTGGAGNDFYSLDTDTTAGTDTIDESDGGIDTLDFSLTTTVAVVVDLTEPSVQPTNGNHALILGSGSTIENIRGGALSDTLTGNSLDNLITGNAGDDTISGAEGADVLTGGAGNDSLAGGFQNDTYIFDTDTSLGSDTISDSDGIDVVDFALTTTIGITLDLAETAAQTVNLRHTLTLQAGTEIETVLGTAKDDVIRGNSAANILVGNAGNDQLEGRAGRDILIGGVGLDAIFGGDDDDLLISGRTTHDNLVGNLNDIRLTWISGNSYPDRITALRAGIGVTVTSLKAKINVLNDSGADDVLTGDQGEDWYFRAVDDAITDLLSGETFDVL
jgi:Ca2+-binding RTX toxin-like protein